MAAGRDKGDDHMATFTVNGQSVTVEKIRSSSAFCGIPCT